jgi:hypothetical protein
LLSLLGISTAKAISQIYLVFFCILFGVENTAGRHIFQSGLVGLLSSLNNRNGKFLGSYYLKGGGSCWMIWAFNSLFCCSNYW